METIKAWITWPDGSQYGMFSCSLILENGWPMYGHFCSSPGYARYDLWNGRKERQEAWKAAGLNLEIVAEVPYSQLPSHVTENNKNEAYVEFAEKYFPEMTKAGEQPSVEIVFSEDKPKENSEVQGTI